jgi:hypothetical protein
VGIVIVEHEPVDDHVQRHAPASGDLLSPVTAERLDRHCWSDVVPGRLGGRAPSDRSSEGAGRDSGGGSLK